MTITLSGLGGTYTFYASGFPRNLYTAANGGADLGITGSSLTKATVQIVADGTHVYEPGADILTGLSGGTNSAVFNPRTGMLTLTGTNGPYTAAQVLGMLQNVNYQNINPNMDPGPRRIDLIVTDGTTPSSPGSIFTTNAGLLTVGGGEGNTKNFVHKAGGSGAGVMQVASLQMSAYGDFVHQATFQIDQGYVPGEDILYLSQPTSAVSGSFNPATGTLTLSGLDTAPDYIPVMENVFYDNLNPLGKATAQNRRIAITVNGCTRAAFVSHQNINVTNV